MLVWLMPRVGGDLDPAILCTPRLHGTTVALPVPERHWSVTGSYGRGCRLPPVRGLKTAQESGMGQQLAEQRRPALLWPPEQ